MKDYHVPWQDLDVIPAAFVDGLMLAEQAEAQVLEDMRRTKS